MYHGKSPSEAPNKLKLLAGGGKGGRGPLAATAELLAESLDSCSIPQRILNKLQPFQIAGIHFLQSHAAMGTFCILNDESHMTKCVTTALFLGYAPGKKKRTLIVVQDYERAITAWRFHFHTLTKLTVGVIDSVWELEAMAEDGLNDRNIYLAKWTTLRTAMDDVVAKINFERIIIDNRGDIMSDSVCFASMWRLFDSRVDILISSADITTNVNTLHRILKVGGVLAPEIANCLAFQRKFGLPDVEDLTGEWARDEYYRKRRLSDDYCRKFRLRRFHLDHEDTTSPGWRDRYYIDLDAFARDYPLPGRTTDAPQQQQTQQENAEENRSTRPPETRTDDSESEDEQSRAYNPATAFHEMPSLRLSDSEADEDELCRGPAGGGGGRPGDPIAMVDLTHDGKWLAGQTNNNVCVDNDDRPSTSRAAVLAAACSAKFDALKQQNLLSPSPSSGRKQKEANQSPLPKEQQQQSPVPPAWTRKLSSPIPGRPRHNKPKFPLLEEHGVEPLASSPSTKATTGARKSNAPAGKEQPPTRPTRPPASDGHVEANDAHETVENPTQTAGTPISSSSYGLGIRRAIELLEKKRDRAGYLSDKAGGCANNRNRTEEERQLTTLIAATKEFYEAISSVTTMTSPPPHVRSPSPPPESNNDERSACRRITANKDEQKSNKMLKNKPHRLVLPTPSMSASITSTSSAAPALPRTAVGAPISALASATDRSGALLSPAGANSPAIPVTGHSRNANDIGSVLENPLAAIQLSSPGTRPRFNGESFRMQPSAMEPSNNLKAQFVISTRLGNGRKNPLKTKTLLKKLRSPNGKTSTSKISSTPTSIGKRSNFVTTPSSATTARPTNVNVKGNTPTPFEPATRPRQLLVDLPRSSRQSASPSTTPSKSIPTTTTTPAPANRSTTPPSSDPQKKQTLQSGHLLATPSTTAQAVTPTTATGSTTPAKETRSNTPAKETRSNTPAKESRFNTPAKETRSTTPTSSDPHKKQTLRSNRQPATPSATTEAANPAPVATVSKPTAVDERNKSWKLLSKRRRKALRSQMSMEVEALQSSRLRSRTAKAGTLATHRGRGRPKGKKVKSAKDKTQTPPTSRIQRRASRSSTPPAVAPPPPPPTPPPRHQKTEPETPHTPNRPVRTKKTTRNSSKVESPATPETPNTQQQRRTRSHGLQPEHAPDDQQEEKRPRQGNQKQQPKASPRKTVAVEAQNKTPSRSPDPATAKTAPKAAPRPEKDPPTTTTTVLPPLPPSQESEAEEAQPLDFPTQTDLLILTPTSSDGYTLECAQRMSVRSSIDSSMADEVPLRSSWDDFVMPALPPTLPRTTPMPTQSTKTARLPETKAPAAIRMLPLMESCSLVDVTDRNGAVEEVCLLTSDDDEETTAGALTIAQASTKTVAAGSSTNASTPSTPSRRTQMLKPNRYASRAGEMLARAMTALPMSPDMFSNCSETENFCAQKKPAAAVATSLSANCSSAGTQSTAMATATTPTHAAQATQQFARPTVPSSAAAALNKGAVTRTPLPLMVSARKRPRSCSMDSISDDGGLTKKRTSCLDILERMFQWQQAGKTSSANKGRAASLVSAALSSPQRTGTGNVSKAVVVAAASTPSKDAGNGATTQMQITNYLSNDAAAATAAINGDKRDAHSPNITPKKRLLGAGGELSPLTARKSPKAKSIQATKLTRWLMRNGGEDGSNNDAPYTSHIDVVVPSRRKSLDMRVFMRRSEVKLRRVRLTYEEK